MGRSSAYCRIFFIACFAFELFVTLKKISLPQFTHMQDIYLRPQTAIKFISQNVCYNKS